MRGGGSGSGPRSGSGSESSGGRRGRYTTVSIPTPLYRKVKAMLADTGFTSVSDYVTYVLRELVAAHEASRLGFTREDEERIRRKLRALGYID